MISGSSRLVVALDKDNTIDDVEKNVLIMCKLFVFISLKAEARYSGSRSCNCMSLLPLK
jgi:hypothetical protein